MIKIQYNNNMNKRLYDKYNDIIAKIVKSNYDRDNALVIISDSKK